MSLAPLMGLPGKIKTLLDRIGSSTPTQLARLDDDVSSRAPASTALSSSTWTPTKAGYLDAAVTSRATQASVDALPTTTIASVQRGYAVMGSNTTLSTANNSLNGRRLDITVSAVDVSKSELRVSAAAGSGQSSFTNDIMHVRYLLVNSTTIRLIASDVSAAATTLAGSNLNVNWELVEYN